LLWIEIRPVWFTSMVNNIANQPQHEPQLCQTLNLKSPTQKWQRYMPLKIYALMCCLWWNEGGSLVALELFVLPEHLNSPRFVVRVCIAQSLVFCGVFCSSLLVIFSLFFWQFFCLCFDWWLLIFPFGVVTCTK
jgi:hypothetical protein